jgi:hypothetical protein
MNTAAQIQTYTARHPGAQPEPNPFRPYPRFGEHLESLHDFLVQTFRPDLLDERDPQEDRMFAVDLP